VFVEKTDEMIAAYRQALEQLREWHALGGGSSYICESLRMHTELEKYLSLWFFVKKREYLQLTHGLQSEVTIDVASRDIHVNQVQRLTDVCQVMAEKLALSREELDIMDALGMPGIERAIELRKLAPAFTEWEIRANEIGISQELCLEEQASATMTQARGDVGDLIVRGAKAAHRIAKLLKKTPDERSPQQQVEELSQLIETFADVDQRFRELPEIYPGHFKHTQLGHLIGLIDQFAKNAQKLRSSVLEKAQPTKVKEPAGPSGRSAPRPKVKVKKTRPRQQTSSETPPTIEESLGELTLKNPARPSLASDDVDIISNGFNLVEDAPRFIEQTRKDAFRPSRIPADMQDLFDQQASKLTQSADSVKEVLARTKQYPVTGLPRDLLTAAKTLREAGKSVRASLYKMRKPTQAIFRWMHENAQIELRRDKGRILTRQLGDYFQEYRILDKTNKDQELWVAHFHYKTLESPRDTPTTAHLKISESYLKTLTDEQRKILVTAEPIDGVLRKIEDPDLRKLFFDLEPAAEN
jgi:hypothetical protein